MSWIKRILLFLIVNACVILTISLILSFFNVQPYLSPYGLNVKSLLIFCLIWGFVGSFISLQFSRKMAKWALGVRLVNPQSCTPEQAKLHRMVAQLAERAHLPMPEVGIFPTQAINAFATGPSKRRSLVAVSQGMLDSMPSNEIEAVLAHELTHIANGDMVTMTLLQGIVNAFVMFFARVLAYVISSRGSSRNRSSSYGSYYLMTFLFEIVFMVFGMMVITAYSRWREYRADYGAARLTSRSQMVAALRHLEHVKHGKLKGASQSLAAMMIIKADEPSLLVRLFSTHPPLARRIERLEQAQVLYA